ncbi:unnamed protein product [Caenorhabditis brenneri]
MNSPESFVKYVEYAQIVAQIGFFSTTFFCFILVFLTNFGVKRSFGSYTYLLILFPVVGIFFATIEMILYPNVYSHNAGYVFYSTSRPFHMSQDAVTWFLAFYTGVYASTISMLSVQFLYRYWAIFDETKLRFFKGWRFLICIVYSLAFGFQWAFGIYYFDEIDEYSKKYMKLEMMQKYSLDISEISGMTLVAYDAEGNFRWRNICCTLNMTLIMLIQYTVIIYCAYFMYRNMEAKLQMLSLSLRNLHKQFFKTLILQIVTPTITLFSPVILIIYLPLLDLEVDLPTGIFLCSFTIYPAMDAVIVMYIVKDYRRAARKMLRKWVQEFYNWLNNGEDGVDIRTKSVSANGIALVNTT